MLEDSPIEINLFQLKNGVKNIKSSHKSKVRAYIIECAKKGAVYI